MSSGIKQLQINTQERAISPDINRLQAFLGKGIAEFWRYAIDVGGGSDDLEAGAIPTEFVTTGTPLRAEVANGLLVRPQLGSLNVLVDPGALYAIAPDADTDASAYKFVASAGVTVLGSLVLTANASGSIRIDVIECELVDTIVETDNRDIFNPGTGLFTAASVTKAREFRLNFRVRAGTPGAGYPGNASGWLPLAVASVPDGTVDNDTVTFWDVRPLFNDRLNGGFGNLTEDWPLVGRSNFSMNSVTVGQLRIAGQFRGGFGARRLGGILRRGTPGTDADYVDLQHADNLASGFAYAGTGFAYAYLLTPFGLPRWARYTNAPSARVPRSPRGIVTVTSVTPHHLKGSPSAAVSLPTSTGLGGSTTSGMLLTPIRVAAGTPEPSIADGRNWHHSTNFITVGAAGFDLTSATFTLTEGTHYPANAKAIFCNLLLQLDVAATSVAETRVSRVLTRAPGSLLTHAAVPSSGMRFVNTTGGVNLQRSRLLCARIPIYPSYPSLTGASFDIEWIYDLNATIGGAPAHASGPTLEILGHDMGP